MRKVAITVVLVLLAIFAARGLTLAALPAFGLAGEPLFFAESDRFADSLKVALAQRAVTAPLQHDPVTASWPETVQRYIHFNEYLQPGMTVQHLPPFSTVLFMGIAALFLWMPPMAIIAALVTGYGTASLALARAAERFSGERVILPVFALLMLSYPALFMIDRGNFHSGFTSLLVGFYVLTAVYGRWRAAGWLALALAANIRPNIAIFALLEFGHDRTFRDTAVALAVIGAAALLVGVGSLALAMAVDHTYSMAQFLDSYGWYETRFVRGADGLAWNLSLPNVIKLAHLAIGHRDLYDPILATGITLLGGVAAMFFFGAHVLRKIPVAQFVFALTALCSMFTPVFAEYHALIFAAPLLLLILKRPQVLRPHALWRGSGVLALLQLACLVFDVRATSGLLPFLALLALAFPVMAIRALGSHGRGGESELVMVLACMAALSPLGGHISNGLIIALLLFATLTWLAARSLSRDRHTPFESHPSLFPARPRADLP